MTWAKSSGDLRQLFTPDNQPRKEVQSYYEGFPDDVESINGSMMCKKFSYTEEIIKRLESCIMQLKPQWAKWNH